ncbi:hypothetical protein [Flavobacterium sp. HBTb2-11-1]|uniref:hypothetical protein n=1 Tax=Flavobacterium sp. HBTb2-11-1 TaxID=2692212 RepID=UPI00136A0B75|nr:hypothetical protein [Flavobacterium sp. HBTb2-11-1]MXO03333.1 hypothetical protein [Flavobacterium sp. HBTb2-11-1]
MITILHYLFLIRFRKLVAKDDSLAVFILILSYIGGAFLIYVNFESFKNYIPFLFLEVVIYHLQRSDLELLKMKRNYKVILFIEYAIYSFPFYLVLLLKKEFVFIVIIILFKIVLINLPTISLKIIKYPFNTFNIYWHISFRKYKLIYILPILIVVTFMAVNSNNENLLYAVFLVLSLIACIPSFEREKKEEIKYNPFSAKKYLRFQFKNSIANTFCLVFPIAISLCFLLQWEKMVFLILVFIAPLFNLLLKYIYFNNSLLQQIFFVIFIITSILFFGVPFLATPFMYKIAIKNLNEFKTC